MLNWWIPTGTLLMGRAEKLFSKLKAGTGKWHLHPDPMMMMITKDETVCLRCRGRRRHTYFAFANPSGAQRIKRNLICLSYSNLLSVSDLINIMRRRVKRIQEPNWWSRPGERLRCKRMKEWLDSASIHSGPGRKEGHKVMGDETKQHYSAGSRAVTERIRRRIAASRMGPGGWV